MNGPWPLTVLLPLLVRHSVLMDWADVVGIDGARIDLRRRAAELRSAVADRS